jgi:hypothetical protein
MSVCMGEDCELRSSRETSFVATETHLSRAATRWGWSFLRVFVRHFVIVLFLGVLVGSILHRTFPEWERSLAGAWWSFSGTSAVAFRR